MSRLQTVEQRLVAAQRLLRKGREKKNRDRLKGALLQQAACLSGLGIGNNLICITKFSAPTSGLTVPQSAAVRPKLISYLYCRAQMPLSTHYTLP